MDETPPKRMNMACGQTGGVGFYSWGVAGYAGVAPGYGGKEAFGQTRTKGARLFPRVIRQDMG